MQIIDIFKYNENKENAVSMKKYLKDNFEFLGIKKPERSKLQKEYIKEISKDQNINTDIVKKLWEMDEREFQYLALDYLVKNKKKLNKENINLIEYLIVTKSWWDTVDIIATHLVGQMCQTHKELIKEYIIKWSTSENMWLRRTAILFQLKYKENVDTKLLTQIIHYNNLSKEFFINKAIGWMLREYSKTNPKWVKEFIDTNELSRLSVREGSKYLILNTNR